MINPTNLKTFTNFKWYEFGWLASQVLLTEEIVQCLWHTTRVFYSNACVKLKLEVDVLFAFLIGSDYRHPMKA